MTSYLEFKKLVVKFCYQDSFNAFQKERRLNEISKTILENEDVIKERYRQLSDHFEDFLDQTFGKDVMAECKDFLERLKKQM